MILALSTAPTTWADHHHAIYVLLVAAVAVCLVIAVLGPLVLAILAARFWWIVWRAAERYRKHPPGAYAVGMSNPDSVTSGRDFMFSTNHERRRQIPTATRPDGLRIMKPLAYTVWSSSLPRTVRRYGKTIFQVREFLPSGFVISDQSPGLKIEGEIFYSELLPPASENPQAPPPG